MRKPGGRRRVRVAVLFWTGLVVLILLFTSLIFELKGRHNPIGGLIMSVVNPVVGVVRALGEGVSSLGLVFQLRSIVRENVELANENALLRKHTAELEATRAEVERLRKLLGLPDLGRFDYVSARIIGRNLDLWFESAWINRGSSDGIEAGDLVVNADGLVGEIVLVEGGRSKVKLILNPDFAIGAITSQSRQQGVVQGKPGRELDLVNTLQLGFVPKKNRIEVGEKVFTSGITTGRPRGVYIGEVTKVVEEPNRMTQTIVVTTAVDLGNLEEVSVILYRAPEEAAE